MTPVQALEVVISMAERKAAIYRGIKDPKQRRALVHEITALAWIVWKVPHDGFGSRVAALRKEFPL